MNDFGRRIGNFRAYGYGVAGTVYAVDESTLYIHGFRYNPPSQSKMNSIFKFNFVLLIFF